MCGIWSIGTVLLHVLIKEMPGIVYSGMILFLPDFGSIDFLCIVHAWWCMGSVKGFLKKKA